MKKTTAQHIAIASGRFNREKEYWLAKLAGELTAARFGKIGGKKRTEVGEQRSEAGGQRSEIGGWMSAASGQMSEAGGWMSAASGQMSESVSRAADGKVEVGSSLSEGARDYRSEKKEFLLPHEVAARLINLSNKSDKRLLMALLAGVKVLLYRYSWAEDLLVVTPVERQSSGASSYLNTALIIRDHVTGAMTYKELLISIKDTLLEAEKNQNYPYNVLLEDLGYEDADILRVGVMLKNLQEKAHMDEIPAEIVFSFTREEMPATLEGQASQGNAVTLTTIRGCLEYQPEIYCAAEVERLIDHFLRLLSGCMQNLDQAIDTLEILSAAEREDLLVARNRTEREFPEKMVIHQFFEEQAQRIPGHPAVEEGNETLTYGELNAEANQLAHLLAGKGVGPDRIVGIMVEPSIEMLIGLLGILKAGGAYLPIDPAYPENRIAHFLQDAETDLLLIQSHLREKVPQGFPGLILELDRREVYRDMPETDLAGRVDPENLAYIIYTSGSTGRPKGVMVPHRGVVNLIHWHVRERAICPADRFAKYASFSFDASVLETFPYLAAGATLVIPPVEIRYEPLKLARWYREGGITGTFLPSSMAELLMRDCPNLSLRHLLTGGEALKTLPPTSYTVVNNYGPAECTVVSTIYKTGDGAHLVPPIGRPIDNMRIYILDQQMNPVPVNVIGEIYIAGCGLTRGYLNQAEMTAERFIPNPYEPGQLMYRSGDLGRWLPDGHIEFAGRVDFQIKIRGYRIETGEIEAVLLKHPGVREAAVLAVEGDNDDRFLAAYLSVEGDVQPASVREYLRQDVPEYMIPEAFVLVLRLPLTENGKVDRRALPKPERGRMSKQFIAPRNACEEGLAAIWAEILHLKEVSIDDNFFELGGQSLKAADLIVQIHRQLGVELFFKDVLATPILADQAALIALKQQGQRVWAPVIIPQPEAEYYPVTSAQKRLFILRQFEAEEKGDINYNMPGAMLIEGELEPARSETAMQALIRRHESLRTSFDFAGEEVVQRVAKDVPFTIEYSVARTDAREDLQVLIVRFIRPFDLTKAPLLRVGLVSLPENRHLFIMDLHHIIADGLSMTILQREFIQLYAGQELAPLTVQYRDFAVWQKEYFTTEEFKKQEAFWINEFAGDIPVLNLPTDHPRPQVMTFAGGTVFFSLPASVRDKLNEITLQNGCTLFMMLLAAYGVLLGKYSNQDELVIGTPLAGRPGGELQNVIGMFVNSLPVRLKPCRETVFTEFLVETRERLLQGMENQAYQFEMLVEQLKLARDMTRNPLFDTMFTMQNLADPLEQVEMDGLVYRGVEFDSGVARFDLTLTGLEHANGISFMLEYNNHLFTQATAARISKHFSNLLAAIAEAPVEPIARLSFLDAAEEEQILRQFNASTRQYDYTPVTAMQFLEDWAERKPEYPAAVYGEEMITYAQLNGQANYLARQLRARGVKAESIVAVMAERSLAMVIGLCAVIKAGGAYLPIDPAYPEARIEYTLQDSGTQLLLTQRKFAQRVPFAGEILFLDELIDVTTNGPGSSVTANLELVNKPEDLAYVIYTSGSTGKPKGVMIEHQNMVNAMQNHHGCYPLKENETYLFLSSFTFDASILEIFGFLPEGGKLCILERDVEKDPVEILRTIARHKISHAHFVPSLLKVVLHELPTEDLRMMENLNYMFVGGEAISQELVKEFYLKIKSVALINLYGPTETSIDATQFPCADAGQFHTVPIGKPVPNARVYILDQGLQLQPVGVPGELCIGGKGVGRGYLNRPELTADKFIPDPYEQGEKMYRSGDLARWLADGNIEFLGRMDQQIKIRGYRIEPGEIESQLRNHSEIEDALVTSVTDVQGNAHLCAYVVSQRELAVNELRSEILRFLPEYMVPSYFVTLPEFPLLPSGKINRQALPAPSGMINTGANFVAPRTDLEQQLAELWKEILGLAEVSVEDSFFQLGGNSLSIIRLFERIKATICERITVPSLFSYHTIAMQANFIESLKVTANVLALQPQDPNLQHEFEEETVPAIAPADELTELLNLLSADELSPEEAAELFARKVQ